MKINKKIVKRILAKSVPIKKYMIGYFVVRNFLNKVVGKIIFKGTLKDIEARFIPSIGEFHADSTCRSLLVFSRFNIPNTYWYRKFKYYPSNFCIVDYDFCYARLPIMVSLTEEIGFIYVYGNCNAVQADFIPSCEITDEEMSLIEIESRPSFQKLKKLKKKLFLKINHF